MQAPPGYFFLDGMVCQLCRSLYGLKQPPRAWIERFSIAIDVGFMPSAHDFALFSQFSLWSYAFASICR
jgi:hypothetical protein